MNIFNLFRRKPKTDLELLAEFDALCDTLIMQQGASLNNLYRYESLLREIYKRGLKPKQVLVPENKND